MARRLTIRVFCACLVCMMSVTLGGCTVQADFCCLLQLSVTWFCPSVSLSLRPTQNTDKQSLQASAYAFMHRNQSRCSLPTQRQHKGCSRKTPKDTLINSHTLHFLRYTCCTYCKCIHKGQLQSDHNCHTQSDY